MRLRTKSDGGLLPQKRLSNRTGGIEHEGI